MAIERSDGRDPMDMSPEERQVAGISDIWRFDDAPATPGDRRRLREMQFLSLLSHARNDTLTSAWKAYGFRHAGEIAVFLTEIGEPMPSRFARALPTGASRRLRRRS